VILLQTFRSLFYFLGSESDFLRSLPPLSHLGCLRPFFLNLYLILREFSLSKFSVDCTGSSMQNSVNRFIEGKEIVGAGILCLPAVSKCGSPLVGQPGYTM